MTHPDAHIFSTVEGMWKHFESSSMSPQAGPLQRKEMRLAFFAGAGIMFAGITQFGTMLSDDDAAAYLNSLKVQLLEWTAQHRRPQP